MAEVQPRPQEAGAAAEGMQDGGDVRVSAQQGGDVVVGLAGMDHDRLTRLARQPELVFERRPLGLPGRVVVVVIETHLPRGHHPGRSEHAPQPLTGFLRPPARLVGVQAGGGSQPRLALAEREGPLRRLRRFADHHHPPDPRRPGPLEHLRPVGVVVGGGEVTVGVDQHRS